MIVIGLLAVFGFGILVGAIVGCVERIRLLERQLREHNIRPWS